MSSPSSMSPSPSQGPSDEKAQVMAAQNVEGQSGSGDVVSSAGPQVIETQRAVDLTPESALRLTAASASRFIVVAGPAESGKTTLLASIYERFLRAPSFAGYCFAGSETLLGLERRCHLSRQASERKTADTERTRRVERVSLMHLRLRREDLTQGSRDLLFTDLSGEIFRQAKDSTDFCKSLAYLLRADRVVLLIDGDRVGDPTTRFVAISEAKDLLRRSYDAGMLGPQSLVDVLLTKWDKIDVLSANVRESIETHVSRAEADLREYFRDRFRTMRFARVAARSDPPSDLPQAYGIADILPAWVEDRGFYTTDIPIRLPKIDREIDKLLIRGGS